MAKKDILLEETPIVVSPTHYIRTSLNYDPSEFDVFEYVDPVSETVPDQVMDLRELLQRSTSGIPIPTRADGYSEEDYPDIWKMDEFELAEFRENLAHKMQEMQSELHVSSKKLEELEEKARQDSAEMAKFRQDNVIKQQKEADKTAETA